MLNIPIELILHILLSLKVGDLNALAQTNKRLYQILNSILWKQNADLALLWAAEHGQEACARKALAFGANINAEHPKTTESLTRPQKLGHRDKLHNKSLATPIFLACAAGQVEMVKFLINVKSIDINVHNNPDHTTPLMIAIIANEEEVVRVLLANKNTDIDTEVKFIYAYGCSLMVASMIGHLNIVQQLLDHGKDPNKGNILAQCSIFLATYYGHQEVVRVLLEAGASPHPPVPRSAQATAWGGWYGDPFIQAIAKGPEMVKEFLKSPLFEMERVREVMDRSRCESLMRKQQENFKFFFSLGCYNVNWNNQDGRTALFWAATYGQEEALKLLLEYVAPDGLERVNVNTESGGNLSREKVLKMQKMGYAGHGGGVTPLISAARQGHIGAVRLLLTANDIDVHRRDTVFGETALMAARSNGHHEIAELLQSYVEE